MSVNRNVVTSRCLPLSFGVLVFFFLKNILLNEKCTNVIYKCIKNSIKFPLQFTNGMKSCLYMDLIIYCIQDVFKVCFKFTFDSSLQWHSLNYPWMLLLKKIKIKTDNCCRFCCTENRNYTACVCNVWKNITSVEEI